MTDQLDPLEVVSRELASLPPPVVVFNKSHSGCSILVRLLQAAGVHMGRRLSAMADSEDMAELVHHLVLHHFPDFSPLWDGRADLEALSEVARRALSGHLEGHEKAGGVPWGWKVSETTYVLPVVDWLFPHARFIHVIRDGRDVAFRSQHGPLDPFWKKIYFNTDRIETWLGLDMTQEAYAKYPHLYNALHWVNSVTLGRAAGAMVRERYLEVRYEDLCLDFEPTSRRVLEFIGLEPDARVIEEIRPTVRVTSLRRFEKFPPRKVEEVLQIAKPLLMALGYITQDH